MGWLLDETLGRPHRTFLEILISKSEISGPLSRVSENFNFSFLTFWLSNLFMLFGFQFLAVIISYCTKL